MGRSKWTAFERGTSQQHHSGTCDMRSHLPAMCRSTTTHRRTPRTRRRLAHRLNMAGCRVQVRIAPLTRWTATRRGLLQRARSRDRRSPISSHRKLSTVLKNKPLQLRHPLKDFWGRPWSGHRVLCPSGTQACSSAYPPRLP